MKALSLSGAAAPAAATADYGHAIPGEGWSTLQTIDAVFCRAFPYLSKYVYDVLSEDGANELDE